MKDRLLRILQVENMTSNKFAELMEVRPSNISHLLAGRNNPNFEFIGRMIMRIPNLNPDWLLNGTGAMYRDVTKDLFGFDLSDVQKNEKIIDQEYDQIQSASIIEDVLKPIEAIDDKEVPVSGDKHLNGLNNQDFEVENESQSLVTENEINNSKMNDDVTKVIVFYGDKTFDIYKSR